jgi:hypothetical protein
VLELLRENHGLLPDRAIQKWLLGHLPDARQHAVELMQLLNIQAVE